ncbi:MAG TPA: GAF domain-containing protein [Anaerolineales bacterium]
MLRETYTEENSLRTNGRSMNGQPNQPTPEPEYDHTEDLAALAIAGASIASSLDVDKVLQVIAQQLTSLLKVPICILADWRPNPGGVQVHTQYANPKVVQLPKNFKIRSLSENVGFTQVIEKSRPMQKHVAQIGITEKEKAAFRKAKISTLLLLPLVAQNKTLGLVELQETRGPRTFSDREIYLAQTLCHQAAVAIENARLFEAAHRQVQELSILNQVATASNESTSEDELIDRATQLIRDNLYPDNLGVLLVEKITNQLRVHPSYQVDKPLKALTIPMGKGITGQVAARGIPLRVGNTRQVKNYLDYDVDTQSELCVPMKIGERVIGVINAESTKPNHFSAMDEQLLLTLAGQLASGIERLRNAVSERRRTKQLSILNKLTGEMSGVLDRDKLFKIVVETLNKEMDYSSTDISLVDEASREYVVAAVSGSFESLIAETGYRQKFGEGLLDVAVRTSQVVVANNIHERPEYKMVPGHETINAELIIPIKIYKRVVAVLNIESNEMNAFDEYEVEALSTLCDQISIALEGINLFDSTRRQLQELTLFHAITHAAVNARSEDELLERATEIIGDSLYPDEFGFMMMSADSQALLVNRNYRGISEEAAKRGVMLSEGVCGHVASTGQPWRVPDVRKEPRYLNVSPNIRSELCVPIHGNNNSVLGVINAESTQLDAFSDKDLRLLNTIAGQMGTAIEKLRLFESERVQREQAETLREVGAILGSAIDSSHVLDLILDQLKRVVPFDSASIQIIKGDNLSVRAIAGELNTNIIGFEIPIETDKVAHPLLYQHRTMIYEDISNHPDWVQLSLSESIKSWIGAPLIVRGESIGVLTVDGFRPKQFSQADAQLVSTFAIHAGIALENARLFEEAQEAYVQTVSALASAIDVRDSYTSGHSQRLAELAVKIGETMGCSLEELVDLRWGALLHDIGKIGVPDEILRKPGSLEEREVKIMRGHPEIGARIVEGVKSLSGVAPIIRAHQERFDGKGYPDGLRGQDIPKVARIISVADAYVAMTDERVYRKARSHEEAIIELKRCKGTQFDPEVIMALLTVFKTGAFPSR